MQQLAHVWTYAVPQCEHCIATHRGTEIIQRPDEQRGVHWILERGKFDDRPAPDMNLWGLQGAQQLLTHILVRLLIHVPSQPLIRWRGFQAGAARAAVLIVVPHPEHNIQDAQATYQIC